MSTGRRVASPTLVRAEADGGTSRSTLEARYASVAECEDGARRESAAASTRDL